MSQSRKVSIVVVDEAAKSRYSFLLDAADTERLTVPDLVQMVASAAQEQLVDRAAGRGPPRAVGGVSKKFARTIQPTVGGGAAPVAYEYQTASTTSPTQGTSAATATAAAALSHGSFDLVSSSSGQVLHPTTVSLAKLNTPAGGVVKVRRHTGSSANTAPPAHDGRLASSQPTHTPSQQQQPRQPLSYHALHPNSVSSSSISFVDATDDEISTSLSFSSSSSTLSWSSSSSSTLSSSPVFESASDTVSFATEGTAASRTLLAPFEPQSVRSIDFLTETMTEGFSENISFHTVATKELLSSYAGTSRTGYPATATTAAAAAAAAPSAGMAATQSTPVTARDHYDHFMNRSRRRDAQLHLAKLQQVKTNLGAAPAPAKATGVTLEEVLVAGRRIATSRLVIVPPSGVVRRVVEHVQRDPIPSASPRGSGTKKAAKTGRRASTGQKKTRSVHVPPDADAPVTVAAATQPPRSGRRTLPGLPLSAGAAPHPLASTPAPAHETVGEATETDAVVVAEQNGGTDAEDVAVPSPPPPPVTEREARLADMVQHLCEDVQRLLAQSHMDASRIAALRGALRDSQMDLRVLQEAHTTSLQQLSAVTETWVQPPVPSTDRAPQAPAPLEAPVMEESMHTAVYADEHDAAAAGVRMQAGTISHEPESTAPPQPPPMPAEEAGKPNEAAEAPERPSSTQGDGTHGEASGTTNAAPLASLDGDASGAQLEGAPAVEDAVASPARHSLLLTQASSLPPSPAPTVIASFAELTPEELRNVVTQMGYVNHNRLLRRENTLLMRQLRIANKAAPRTFRGDVAPRIGSSTRRLSVLVRVRPARLTAHAGTSARVHSGGGGIARPAHTHHRDAHAAEADAAVVEELRSLQAAAGATAEAEADADDAASAASSVLSSRLSLGSALGREGCEGAVADDAKDRRGDVLLQCDSVRSRLVVWCPDVPAIDASPGDVSVSYHAASGDDFGALSDEGMREEAALRGVAVVGPPVPQCVATAVTHSAASESGGETVSPHQCSSTAARLAGAAQQRAMFDDTVRPLVEGMVCGGESATVFAYGPARTGKTYTIFGDCGVVGRQPATAGVGSPSKTINELQDESLPGAAGFVPRALQALLTELHDKAAGEQLLLRSLYASRHDAAFHAGDRHTRKAGASAARAAALQALVETPMYELQCTMVEVYGDEVRDLLAPKRIVPREDVATRTTRTTTTTTVDSPQGGSCAACGASGAAAPRVSSPTSASAAAAAPRQRACQKASPSPERHAYVSVSPTCTLKTNRDGSVEVIGAVSLAFRTLDDGLALVRSGLANRQAHGSHVVFTLTLRQQVWRFTDPEATTKPVKAAKKPKKSPSQVVETAPSLSSTMRTTGALVATPTSARIHSPRRGLPLWVTAPAGKSQPATSARTRPTLKRRADVVLLRSEKEVATQEGAAQPRSPVAAAQAEAGGAAEDEHTAEDDCAVLTGDHAAAATAAGLEAAEAREHAAYLGLRTVKTVTSRLVFVDLASVPRKRKAQATGEPETARQQEAQATRKSLAALRGVTAALYGHPLAARASTSGSRRIPFRAHPLTMLLRVALTKSPRCIMIGCVALSEIPMRAVLCYPSAQTSADDKDHHTTAAEHEAHALWSSTVTRFLVQRQQQQQQQQQQQFLGYSPKTPSSPTATRFSPTDGPPHRKGKTFPKTKNDSRRVSVSKATTASIGIAAASAPASPCHRGDSVTSFSPRRSHASQSRPEKCTAALERRGSVGKLERLFSASDLSASQPGVEPQPSSEVRELLGSVSAMSTHSGAEAVPSPWMMASSSGVSYAAQKPHPELRILGAPESSVADMHAIQVATAMEDAAAAQALWIAPRETLSTFVFLSRLWKV